MNKSIFTFAMFFSLSISASSFGLNYNTWDIEGTTIDGPGLTFSGNNENFIYDLDIFKLSANGASLTANVTELGYAIGDASEGALFLGFHSADSNLSGVSRVTDAQIGWVKRGHDGTQIKISVVGDEDNSVIGDFQIPMGNGYAELGFWNNDGDTLWKIGYSWKF
tara:strand:- start:336 stop:830 length:495 start_codon:yes stop_codon:yes gene_type:complete